MNFPTYEAQQYDAFKNINCSVLVNRSLRESSENINDNNGTKHIK